MASLIQSGGAHVEISTVEEGGRTLYYIYFYPNGHGARSYLQITENDDIYNFVQGELEARAARSEPDRGLPEA